MNSRDNIATIDQFIGRIRAMFSDKQRAEVEFLKAQVRTLLEIIGDKRILLTDEQRAGLARAGIETKDSLAETSLIFKPETILKWHRALKAAKWNFSKTPFQSPNCNAFAERFVREARETLDNLILVGQTHLQHVLRQIQDHHNSCRPHQGIENHIPIGYEYPDKPAPPKNVRRKAFLGGLLNHYYVDKAA